VRDDNPRTRPWREAVTWHAVAAKADSPLDGPLWLEVLFTFTRPKSHFRANGDLKENAPLLCDRKFDLDKLARAICDSLTQAGAIVDDKRIAHATLRKVWGESASATVSVREI